MAVKLLFSFCLTAALYGTILGVIVYLLNMLLKRQFPAGFRFALWIITAVRFLVPLAPETRFSLFNLLPRRAESVSAAKAVPLSGGTDVFLILGIIWLSVAALLILRGIIARSVMRRRISRLKKYDDPIFEAELSVCAKRLRIKKKIVPIMQNEIETPAVFGYFRPKLLLGKDAAEMPLEEQRHIILHECCHVKRRDILSGYLLSIVRAVYWFDPLVYLFEHKARQEMEMAADAKAMGYMKNDERIGYGMTIINTAAKFSTLASAAVGMSGEKRGIKSRIKSVAAFKKPAVICRVLCSAAVVLIGCTCLTNAKLPEPIRPESSELYQAIVTEHQFSPSPKKANGSADNAYARPAEDIGVDNSAESAGNTAAEVPQTDAAAPDDRGQTASGDDSDTPAQTPSTVIIRDAGIYSSNDGNSAPRPDSVTNNGSETETVLYSRGDGANVSVKSNRLMPGTDYDDVRAEAEADGRTPDEIFVKSGETRAAEKEPISGEVSVYLSSESSDMVTVEVSEGGTALGRLFLKPRTFASYTVSGLSDICRLEITAAAPTKALIY